MVWVYRCLFNQSPIDEHLFPFLDYCESPLWIFVYRFSVKHKFSFLWDKCWRVWLLGHMVSTLFSFITNCLTIFQNGCSLLHSHQQCTSDPVSLHTCQYLVSSLFFILAVLRCVWWHLVVLICILLMANEVEHLFTFICHLYIFFSALLLLLFLFLPIFYLGCLFLFCWDLKVLYIFLIQAFCQICGVQLFSPNLHLVFSSSLGGLSWSKN